MSDQTLEPLVVARIRGDKPTFTSVVSFKELFEAIQEKLPVDKVYIVQEGPGGYSFREAGILMVTFQAIGESLPHPELPASPSPLVLPAQTQSQNGHQDEQPAPRARKSWWSRGKAERAKDRASNEPINGSDSPSSPVKTQSGSIQVDGYIPGQPADEAKYTDVQGFD